MKSIPQKIALALMLPVAALAHTTSIGYVPGANPGEVTFWTGSYAHGGGVINEGTLTLTGVSLVFSQSVNFNIAPTSVKPAGLIDGTNNFFWNTSTTPGFSYDFPVSVDPILFGGVVVWQGVTFTGLNAGTYDVTCGATCGASAQWSSLSTAGAVQNLSGGVGADTLRFTLNAGDIGGGVPEPASIALTGVGAAVLVALRRRSG